MTTTITDLDDFKALDPFFRIIEKGLEGIADGGHNDPVTRMNCLLGIARGRIGWSSRSQAWSLRSE